jgi:hypothetical protein
LPNRFGFEKGFLGVVVGLGCVVFSVKKNAPNKFAPRLNALNRCVFWKFLVCVIFLTRKIPLVHQL